jgi:hypothetical protein
MLAKDLTEREKAGFAQLWKRFRVPVHFVVGADYMALGDWRPVINAGRRNLHIKLLCYFKNPAASLEDHENLVTSYKEDEKVAVMPVSWVKADISPLVYTLSSQY